MFFFLNLLIDDRGKNEMLLNVINDEKYCPRSTGGGIGNTLLPVCCHWY